MILVDFDIAIMEAAVLLAIVQQREKMETRRRGINAMKQEKRDDEKQTQNKSRPRSPWPLNFLFSCRLILSLVENV